jgi:signal peptidase I
VTDASAPPDAVSDTSDGPPTDPADGGGTPPNGPAPTPGDDSGKPAKAPPSTVRNIVEWILVLGGALIIALLIRTFLFTTFWIPSASMEPTLIGQPDRHDRIIVNRLSYKLHDVHRGDIIVFEKPPGETATTEDGRPIKDLIKRVIGLPGETVTLRGGHVFVDGRQLEESYLPDGTQTVPICGQRTEFKVPKDHVLVFGDNRTNSTDGRCFGPIDEDTIVGRAFFRFWPLTEIDWL